MRWLKHYIAAIGACLLVLGCATPRQFAAENAGNLGTVVITVSHRSEAIDLTCAGFGCVVEGVAEAIGTGSSAGAAFLGGQQQALHRRLADAFRPVDPDIARIMGNASASALRAKGVSVARIIVTPFVNFPQPAELIGQIGATDFDTVLHISIWGSGLTRSVTQPYSPTVLAIGYLVRRSDSNLLYRQSYHCGTAMGGASVELKSSAPQPRFNSVADAMNALPQVASGLEVAANIIAHRFADDIAR